MPTSGANEQIEDESEDSKVPRISRKLTTSRILVEGVTITDLFTPKFTNLMEDKLSEFLAGVIVFLDFKTKSVVSISRSIEDEDIEGVDIIGEHRDRLDELFEVLKLLKQED